jgi:putative redox protein
MDAHGEWIGGFESRLDDGRGHVVTVDLPADEGGKDSGMGGLELTVLSLAGCINIIFGLVARRRKLPFTGLSVHLTAERPPRTPTITKVHGTFEVRSSAPKEDVETAFRLTMKTCPVGVLFDQAHIPVDVVLNVVPS